MGVDLCINNPKQLQSKRNEILENSIFSVNLCNFNLYKKSDEQNFIKSIENNNSLQKDDEILNINFFQERKDSASYGTTGSKGYKASNNTKESKEAKESHNTKISKYLKKSTEQIFPASQQFHISQGSKKSKDSTKFQNAKYDKEKNYDNDSEYENENNTDKEHSEYDF